MRISVVTPNYNMAAFLPATMRSVFANLGNEDEYFIIDGGSIDGSVGIVEAYADRLTGWVSEKDSGYADALAKGFDRATGDILCWINSGDLLLGGAFERVRAIFADCEAALVFGDDFYVDADGRVIRYSRGYVPDLASAMLDGGWTPLQDACFWKRDLYEEVGGLDVSLKYAADFDIFLRMALAGNAEYVPFAFSAFRRHDGQKSIAGADRYAIEKEAVRRRILERSEGGHGRGWWMWSWNRIAMTNRMRLRARLAPLLWARPDLAGCAIDTLPCARYWPREDRR